MKSPIQNLNKAFENRIRLGIMSILVVEEYVDFSGLKQALQITDGNLASHLKSLEKVNYIRFQKSFLNRKPNTKYMATDLGKDAFTKHLEALEALLKNIHKQS